MDIRFCSLLPLTLLAIGRLKINGFGIVILSNRQNGQLVVNSVEKMVKR
jgi:hypothetical protein